MDVPDAMVETAQKQMIDEFAQQLSMQGLSLDQYFMFTGMTKEMMMEQTKPRAEKRLKARLVLEEIAKAEGIEASEEEYEAQLKEMADGYKMDMERVRKMISAYDKKQMMKDLAIKKAIDFVVENAKEK